MTDHATKPPPPTGREDSPENRLTDAYHRSGSQPDVDKQVFVLIFGDRVHQFVFHRGDSQSHVAARLHEFADKISNDGGSGQ